MNMDLSPRFATKKSVDGEFGSYYSWSSSDFPLLADAKVGCGKLRLQPRCLALPHYSDSSKVGYVLQGTGGLTGMVFPGESKESIAKLVEGDVIPVPMGVVSWWFNNGDTELVIVFLGETSTAYVPGEFTYFFVAGVQSMLGGFSDELITRILNVGKEDATKLLKNQTGALLVKVDDGLTFPEPANDADIIKLASSISKAQPDVYVKKGGSVTTMGVSKMAFFGQVGLSAAYIVLAPNAVYSPAYLADGAVNMIYVIKGSGRVQIMGLNGKQAMDSQVKAGEMFVVPRLFVVAKLAGEEGMECFSVVTSSQMVLQEFVSKASIFAAISPEVVRASLDVSPDLGEALKLSVNSQMHFSSLPN